MVVDETDRDELDEVLDVPVEIMHNNEYLSADTSERELPPSMFKAALERGYAVDFVRYDGDRVDFRPIETRTETVEVERDVTTFVDEQKD